MTTYQENDTFLVSIKIIKSHVPSSDMQMGRLQKSTQRNETWLVCSLNGCKESKPKKSQSFTHCLRHIIVTVTPYNLVIGAGRGVTVTSCNFVTQSSFRVIVTPCNLVIPGRVSTRKQCIRREQSCPVPISSEMR